MRHNDPNEDNLSLTESRSIARLECSGAIRLLQLPFFRFAILRPASRVAGTTGTHHHVRQFLYFSETTSLPKIEKLASNGSVHLEYQLLGRLRLEHCLRPGFEAAVNYNHITALQPRKTRVSSKESKTSTSSSTTLVVLGEPSCNVLASEEEALLNSKPRWALLVVRIFQEDKLFGKLRQADHLRSKVRDQPGQHGKTLSLLKIQKLALARPVIPALWEVEAGGAPEVGSLRPAWPTWQNPVSTKNTKISQAWWFMSVIRAIREADVGESLKPRRRRLQQNAVAHSCNPSTSGGQEYLEMSQAWWHTPLVLATQEAEEEGYGEINDTRDLEPHNKKRIIGPVWWLTTVVPVFWETEAGGSLEARNLKPAWGTQQDSVSIKNKENKLEAVANACNPSTLGGQGSKNGTKKGRKLGRAQWLTSVIPALWRPRQVDHLKSGVQKRPGQHGKTPSLLKIQKISQVWWWVPIIPATWEAEAGESLEPGRQRLQSAEVAPLHSSLGLALLLSLERSGAISAHGILHHPPPPLRIAQGYQAILPPQLPKPARRTRNPGQEALNKASVRASPGPACRARHRPRSRPVVSAGSGRRDLLPGRRHSPDPLEGGRRNTKPGTPRVAATRSLLPQLRASQPHFRPAVRYFRGASDGLELARWLTPVIPALREAKVAGSPEIGISRPAWPTRAITSNPPPAPETRACGSDLGQWSWKVGSAPKVKQNFLLEEKVRLGKRLPRKMMC
ncbi:putative uncharacterized protein C8orf44 [Plecturocebus cupreus]